MEVVDPHNCDRRIKRAISWVHSRRAKLSGWSGGNSGRHNFVARCTNCFQKHSPGLYCPLSTKDQRNPSRRRHLIMKTDLLLRQTRMHFPRLDVAEIKIAPINKGGSDRKFYRIRCSPDQTLILVKYNLEREENRHYVQIAKFLEEHGIRVPKIYF